MADRSDLHTNPDARDLNGVTLWEALEAFEAYERGEGRICNANVIARAVGTLRQFTAAPSARELVTISVENGRLRALANLLPDHISDELRFVYSHTPEIREIGEYAGQVIAAETWKALGLPA